jgi:transcriptional regulator with XRE-family HTH domain
MDQNKKEYFVKFGKRLKLLRKNYGYSLSKVANNLGVVKQTVSAYEQGVTRIQVDKLYQLSLLYEINLIEFFLDVEDEIPRFHNSKYEKQHDIKIDATESAIIFLHQKLQKQITEVENIKHQLETQYGQDSEFANDGSNPNVKKEA